MSDHNEGQLQRLDAALHVLLSVFSALPEVRPQAVAALIMIGRRPGLATRDIEKRLGVSQSVASLLLRQLRAAYSTPNGQRKAGHDLVRALPDPTNETVTCYFLNARGLAALETLDARLGRLSNPFGALGN